MSYLRDRKNAMVYAFSGLWQSFRKETHMRLHALSTICVLAAGFYFQISRFEWLAILGCVALVMITEILNSAIEKICDMITADIHPTIKYIKDISAAAVLLACLLAVVVGVVVFWHHLVA
jgi:diacylglycerol kinase (ATP)